MKNSNTEKTSISLQTKLEAKGVSRERQDTYQILSAIDLNIEG
jgi:hypothetical protein